MDKQTFSYIDCPNETQRLVRRVGLCGDTLYWLLLLSLDCMRVFLEQHFTSKIASQAAWVLKPAGMNVFSAELSIACYGFSVDIKYGCYAVYETSVPATAMAACHKFVKDRIDGTIVA